MVVVVVFGDIDRLHGSLWPPGLRGRGWNPGPATRVQWEWRLERPVRSLQRLTVGPSYFPLLKCLFRMQEFHRNHVEISQESVQFHRKNAEIVKKIPHSKQTFMLYLI